MRSFIDSFRQTLWQLVVSLALVSSVHAQDLTSSIPYLPTDEVPQVTITYRAVIRETVPTSTDQIVHTAEAVGDNVPLTPFSPVILLLNFNDFIIGNPAYAFWNGFLSMLNVLTVINTDAGPISGQVLLFDDQGTLQGAQPIALAGNSELDILVNLLPGFSPQAVGLLQIQFDRAVFDGNTVNYRFSPLSFDGLEFSQGALLQNPLRSESYVLFNTMQPSRKPGQEMYEVTNWLQLANLDGTKALALSVEFYSQEGNLLQTVGVNIPPMARRDIPAGHVVPGNGNVGLLRIIPSDRTQPYLAQLARYGASGPITALAKFFYFSQLLEARAASARENIVPISREGQSENWVVVANPAATDGSYLVEFFRNDGQPLASFPLDLPPRQQLHIFANAFLGSGSSGIVRISPLTGSSFIVESNVYFNDAATLETRAAYGVVSRRTVGPVIDGSFNTFLRQANFVQLFNSSFGAVTAGLTLFAGGGPLGSLGVDLEPVSGSELALFNLSFAPPPNIYGPVAVTAPTNTTSGFVLRLQSPSANETVNAAELLPLR